MAERYLESVPDPEPELDNRAIVSSIIRMDLATRPDLVREHMHWMNEADHERFRQLETIANDVARGDMAKKDAIMESFARDSMQLEREASYSLDDELAKVVPLVTPEEPEKRVGWVGRKIEAMKQRRAVGAARVAIVSVLTVGAVQGLRSRDPSGDDAA